MNNLSSVKIIDGKAAAARVLREVRIEVEQLMRVGIQPGLAVVLVGSDPALSAGRPVLAVAREDGRWANRSLLIDASGAVVARYDKLHMFDVDLASGESKVHVNNCWVPNSIYPEINVKILDL